MKQWTQIFFIFLLLTTACQQETKEKPTERAAEMQPEEFLDYYYQRRKEYVNRLREYALQPNSDSIATRFKAYEDSIKNLNPLENQMISSDTTLMREIIRINENLILDLIEIRMEIIEEVNKQKPEKKQ